jgi:hypothetical protein
MRATWIIQNGQRRSSFPRNFQIERARSKWRQASCHLARALEPFSIAVGTLDGMHLATIECLRGRGADVELACYDERLLAVAGALGVWPTVL